MERLDFLLILFGWEMLPAKGFVMAIGDVDIDVDVDVSPGGCPFFFFFFFFSNTGDDPSCDEKLELLRIVAADKSSLRPEVLWGSMNDTNFERGLTDDSDWSSSE